jgi:hypothetical protein
MLRMKPFWNQDFYLLLGEFASCVAKQGLGSKVRKDDMARIIDCDSRNRRSIEHFWDGSFFDTLHVFSCIANIARRT